ncbi:hypothetical protein D3C80_2228240 [compost metagenome]
MLFQPRKCLLQSQYPEEQQYNHSDSNRRIAADNAKRGQTKQQQGGEIHVDGTPCLI